MIVPPVFIKEKEFSAPKAGPVKLSNLLTASAAREYEYAWLSKVKEALENSFINERISWSAYHAYMQKEVIPPAGITALLPLFPNSVAMIKHSMNIIKEAIQHLNTGQTPVLACDQPFYALAKKIQHQKIYLLRRVCAKRAKACVVHFDYWLKTLS